MQNYISEKLKFRIVELGHHLGGEQVFGKIIKSWMLLYVMIATNLQAFVPGQPATHQRSVRLGRIDAGHKLAIPGVAEHQLTVLGHSILADHVVGAHCKAKSVGALVL